MNTLVILALSLVVGDLEHLDNLAVNPSFETDENRDDRPDGWLPMAFDSPAELTWDNDAARTGRRSLRIRDSARAGDQSDWKTCTGRWVSAPRPVAAGTEYTLEIWAKTAGVTGQAYAHLAWQRGSSWLSEEATQRISGTGPWQKLTVTAVAPDDADSLIVSMNLTRSQGTAWFDDIRVSGKSEMPPSVEYVFSDTGDWFPFQFPLDDTNLDTIDLTSLLHAPAGKRGFVTVRPDGHFYFEDGSRARFFGTNVGGNACAPERTDAPVIAARLAKYGVNMLRLHSLDGRYGPLIDGRDGTSQKFDPQALDRMDYFVAQLKQRGIYIYMDLLDYRWFRTADGVAQGDQFTHNWQGSMKGASIFDPRMIELQKDYATRLLTHLNPYTGLRYIDEPAMAVVETTNENSIFYFFLQTDLSRPYYRQRLTERWNRWLATQYGDREDLTRVWTDGNGRCALKADEDPSQGSVAIPFGMLGRVGANDAGSDFDPLVADPRVSDLLRFFAEIQRQYYDTLHWHLKQIGVRVPIAGTNQTFGVADTFVDADTNDFMSRNQYWRHPHRTAQPFFKFSDEPMLRVDLPTQRTPLAVITSTSVVGRPQAVAEFNFPWPNQHRAEGLLMSAAYACLQDWDIFLLFSYDPSDQALSMFRSQSDPARWGEYPAAAMMFHRGDVARGRNEVHVVHTPENMFTPQPGTRDAKYTNYRFLTFLSKTRNAFIDDDYPGGADAMLACGPSADVHLADGSSTIRLREQPWEKWLYPDFVEAAKKLGLPGYENMQGSAKRLDADTGQLSLDYGRGLFTINTPATKAAVGFLAEAGPLDLDGLTIDCQTPFATITATSLDGQPLSCAQRILVTSVGRAENTAQGFWPPTQQQLRWGPVAWMLPGEGRPPVIAEPIQATVGLNVAGQAVVYALDSTGKRQLRLPSTTHDGRLQFNPAQADSIWCEVVVED